MQSGLGEGLTKDQSTAGSPDRFKSAWTRMIGFNQASISMAFDTQVGKSRLISKQTSIYA